MPVLPASMPAAVYYGTRDLRVEDRAVPAPAAGELLLRVGVVGVCGTDSSEWDHGPTQIPLLQRHPASGHLGPMALGHEFSGTVVAVGEHVDPEWIGQRVASCGAAPCGTCSPCLRGESNLCRRYAGVGLHREGALAGYVATPVESAVSIEGLGISLDEAALCQPMGIAVHNVRRAGDVAGQLVVVLGVGGIGAFLVFALEAAGATVIAADLSAERLGIAREMGAHELVQTNADAGDVELLAAAVGDRDLRVVFEVSGTAGGLATSLAVAPAGARIVAVGIQRRPVEIDLGRMTIGEKSIIGTNALVREIDFPRAVDLVASRAGGWSGIAPEVLPLSELVEGALRPMSEGRPPAIKTLIDPWADSRRPLTAG
jgi:(R,R)-butanediol dehydrogenase/meso-butanediol dehydrogenase/diacetyl reductase